jgi:hypothetical protein
VTLMLAGIAGSREPVRLLAALVTIVSGSVVYYAVGLHRRVAAWASNGHPSTTPPQRPPAS